MSLLQMSFSGALLILAVIIARTVLIHKLPKRTFLALWGIVMLRLLIPFSVPSVFSVYTLIDHNIFAEEGMDQVSAADLIFTGGAEEKALSDNPDISNPVSLEAQKFADNSAQEKRHSGPLSVWIFIWTVGGAACAVFFVIAYLRWRFEFRTSLPVSNAFVENWLKTHRLARPVSVRQSGRITAPLTYGIFHPTILIPQEMDWENRRQLQYIFLHEYVHIRRFDTAAKLAAAAALCVHWFNPLVWLMYLLFNRDIELACDECVVRQMGENSKSEYALALIGMEEKKSGLLPAGSYFSKNAIEERITAIMKIKKTSLAALLAAAALIISMTIVFATSAAAEDKQRAAPVTDFTEEEYEQLLALQFDGYEEMTVSSYQTKVWKMTDTDAYRDLLERFSINEKLYEMRDSNDTAAFLHYVLEPLTAWKWQSRDFSGYAATNYPQQAENAVLEYIITLKILNADKLTVGEYNAARQNIVHDLNQIMIDHTSYELRDAAFMQAVIDEEIEAVTAMYGTTSLEAAVEYSYMPLSNIEEEKMEEWEEERRDELDRILSPYVSFGLTYHYDFDTDTYRMFFQGKEVRGIYDEKENLWIAEHAGIGEGIYDNDAAELYAVYENGRLAGLRESTAQEQKEWSDLRRQNTEEWKKSQEARESTPGTEKDYQSLLALKTPDYRSRSVADFNRDLLEWANENYDRMERINGDTGCNDFQVSLDSEELSFVTLTANLSGTENGKQVQSIYTGRAEEAPAYNQYLTQKTVEENGRAAWCSLWYQFSYSIGDKNLLTVGERDRRVKGMVSGIEKFWRETDIEETLKMTETDVIEKLRQIAEENSGSRISLSIEQVQFEKMDERNMR